MRSNGLLADGHATQVPNLVFGTGGRAIPLDRALLGLGRDSDLRRRYLRARWQQASVSKSERAIVSPCDLKTWWSRRVHTPVGSALARLQEN